MIKQYIKNKKGQRIGLLVATSVPPGTFKTRTRRNFVIGWSACNIKHDRFDNDLAMALAQYRMKEAIRHNTNYIKPNVTAVTKVLYGDFYSRCERYFKKPQENNT